MNNKDVEDVADLKERLGIYEASIDAIDMMNQHAVGVSFAENWTADLGDDEYEKLNGLIIPDEDEDDDEQN